MKERPILFTGAMVRALLDGSKTQTRRAVKIKPPLCTPPYYATGKVRTDLSTQPGAWMEFRYNNQPADGASFLMPCPYGQPGDQLWVRETFRKVMGQTAGWIETDYRATYQHGDRLGDLVGMPGKWTPSIHMPRDASRIQLEITDVCVERLQDISQADCIAEGAPGGHGSIPGYNYSATPYEHYRHIWESINGAGSWVMNPWVWVVEFRCATEEVK